MNLRVSGASSVLDLRLQLILQLCHKVGAISQMMCIYITRLHTYAGLCWELMKDSFRVKSVTGKCCVLMVTWSLSIVSSLDVLVAYWTNSSFRSEYRVQSVQATTE